MYFCNWQHSFICRYKKLLSSVDLTKDFFYSYTYPIMHSLQKNVLSTCGEGIPYEDIFVWNAFLTQAIRSRCNNTMWTIALVHGHFKQVLIFCIFIDSLMAVFSSLLYAYWFWVFAWVSWNTWGMRLKLWQMLYVWIFTYSCTQQLLFYMWYVSACTVMWSSIVWSYLVLQIGNTLFVPMRHRCTTIH